MDEETGLLIDTLFTIGAVKLADTTIQGQGFRLAAHDRDPSLPLSAFYLNLRTPYNPKPGPLTAEVLGLIGSLLYATHRDLRCDGIAGIPNAGVPIAEAFANAARKKGRKLPILKLGKQDGSRELVLVDDAGMAPASIVLLIDDILTGADSKMRAADVLGDNLYDVRDNCNVCDRNQGGKDILAGRAIRTHALFTAQSMVERRFQTGKIDERMRNIVLASLSQKTTS